MTRLVFSWRQAELKPVVAMDKLPTDLLLSIFCVEGVTSRAVLNTMQANQALWNSYKACLRIRELVYDQVLKVRLRTIRESLHLELCRAYDEFQAAQDPRTKRRLVWEYNGISAELDAARAKCDEHLPAEDLPAWSFEWEAQVILGHR